jgi:hypothetical protein
MKRFCILLSLVLLAGCGGNPARLETAPVEGTVTLDGQPVTEGVVIFTPERGRAGKGQIQPDGSFTVSTYGSGDGAVVGHHQVAVVAMRGGEEMLEDVVDVEWIVPERYANPNTSGIEFDVEPDKTNTAPIDLQR